MLNRPDVGGGMGGQNCGQILNVIFRNLHPYRLSNVQLFCSLVMQQNLDPGVPSPALISDWLPTGKKNNITYYGFRYIFLNEQTFQLMKMIKILGYKSVQVILGVSRDLFKVF